MASKLLGLRGLDVSCGVESGTSARLLQESPCLLLFLFFFCRRRLRGAVLELMAVESQGFGRKLLLTRGFLKTLSSPDLLWTPRLGFVERPSD